MESHEKTIPKPHFCAKPRIYLKLAQSHAFCANRQVVEDNSQEHTKQKMLVRHREKTIWKWFVSWGVFLADFDISKFMHFF